MKAQITLEVDIDDSLVNGPEDVASIISDTLACYAKQDENENPLQVKVTSIFDENKVLKAPYSAADVKAMESKMISGVIRLYLEDLVNAEDYEEMLDMMGERLADVKHKAITYNVLGMGKDNGAFLYVFVTIII